MGRPAARAWLEASIWQPDSAVGEGIEVSRPVLHSALTAAAGGAAATSRAPRTLATVLARRRKRGRAGLRAMAYDRRLAILRHSGSKRDCTEVGHDHPPIPPNAPMRG